MVMMMVFVVAAADAVAVFVV